LAREHTRFKRRLETESDYLIELRSLVSQLGQKGGLISPAVYDTAQVLRLAPVANDRECVIAWLIAQQNSDGGWGPQAAPCARDLPTLAAALALRAQCLSKEGHTAAEAGFAFLRRYAPKHWSESIADDAPVAVELLLPRLLDEAVSEGIELPITPYTALRAQGEQKRRMIVATRPTPGAAPTHSWEAWGSSGGAEMIDGTGGVGHSPAATASWLETAVKRNDLNAACKNARRYLKAAAEATCESDHGVMPTAWPIDRFEQIWGLHALLIAGLIDHPFLQDVARDQMLNLSRSMRPEGIGFSDFFVADGDCTATAAATLFEAGYTVDTHRIYRFEKGDSFITYPHEIQPSLTTTAHAVLALALAGDDVSRFARYLQGKQSPDGRWVGDKWHSSWLYTTAEVMTALAHANRTQTLPTAVAALLRCQRADGGWGCTDRSTLAETAYVALAFQALRSRGVCVDQIQGSLPRAAAMLADNYDEMTLRSNLFWIDKELYCPYRIDQAYILSAMIALNREHGE
jgi:halimadienyl-diphosphate synthase